MKVLIVEDEKKVRNFITQALSDAGMAVNAVSGIEDMFVALETDEYDALVMDRLLGGEDSLTSIAKIRRIMPKLRILILSALSEAAEKVDGLSEGADDYLGKPFHVSELIARIRALVRRDENVQGSVKDTEIVYRDLRIELETQRVFRGGKKIELTGKEFKMLCVLARHAGRIFSKSKLLDEVWDLNHFPESNVVEVTIANLRSKIDRGLSPLVHSRRGVGYWLGEK